jgi:hypothetical protein
MSDMVEESDETNLEEPSFFVTIQVNVTLKKSEMWPDGDGPDEPTEADVLALIGDEGGPIEILREWNLGDDVTVHVRKKKTDAEVDADREAERARWAAAMAERGRIR